MVDDDFQSLVFDTSSSATAKDSGDAVGTNTSASPSGDSEEHDETPVLMFDTSSSRAVAASETAPAAEYTTSTSRDIALDETEEADDNSLDSFLNNPIFNTTTLGTNTSDDSDSERAEEPADEDQQTVQKAPEAITLGEINTRKAEYHHHVFDSSEYRPFPLYPIVGAAIEAGASDIYITSGRRVSFKILDEVHYRDDWGVVSRRDLREMLNSVSTEVDKDDFATTWELDSAYTVRQGPHTGRRCRINATRTFPNEITVQLRISNDRIPDPEDLGIGSDITRLIERQGGLVLFTGVTGSGKTSSIASILGKAQRETRKTIITIEKPVEYVFPYKPEYSSVMIQREVGKNTKSFTAALESAMRQNPNIILVGEVRNLVEVQTMLHAAISGHLTFSTVHSYSAPVTLSRIAGMYDDPGLRAAALQDLADVSRCFVSQVLVRALDGSSRFAVRETLFIDRELFPEVYQMILRGDTGGLEQYMRRHEMTLDHELAKAVIERRCAVKDVLEVAQLESRFVNILDGMLKAAGKTRGDVVYSRDGSEGWPPELDPSRISAAGSLSKEPIGSSHSSVGAHDSAAD